MKYNSFCKLNIHWTFKGYNMEKYNLLAEVTFNIINAKKQIITKFS